MPRKKLSPKEKLISAEVTRLSNIFKDLDGNKLKAVNSLIETAAFMTVSLAELQRIINIDGYTCEYKHGENQSGVKQTEEVKTYISMTKNLTVIIKQLADLAPPEKRRDSRLAALRGG